MNNRNKKENYYSNWLVHDIDRWMYVYCSTLCSKVVHVETWTKLCNYVSSSSSLRKGMSWVSCTPVTKVRHKYVELYQHSCKMTKNGQKKHIPQIRKNDAKKVTYTKVPIVGVNSSSSWKSWVILPNKHCLTFSTVFFAL